MTTQRKPKNYLNNRDLLKQYGLSVEQNKMTEEFAKMMMMLVDRLCTKGNFASYTYLDDMKAYTLLMIVRQWRAFDPTRTTNAFAFYTQCAKNGLYQYLNKEKKHRELRDALLIDGGFDPSNTYINNYEADRNDEIKDQAPLYRLLDKARD